MQTEIKIYTEKMREGIENFHSVRQMRLLVLLGGPHTEIKESTSRKPQNNKWKTSQRSLGNMYEKIKHIMPDPGTGQLFFFSSPFWLLHASDVSGTAVEKQTSTLAAYNIFVRRVLLVSFINLTGAGSDAMRLWLQLELQQRTADERAGQAMGFNKP